MRLIPAFCALSLLMTGAAVGGKTVDAAADRLQNLPRKPLGERTAVTIYQFRSGIASLNNAAATDMFTTALVRSGQFRVVERAQFNPGVIAEKSLNAAGKTTGTGAQIKLTAAKYIFEGAISEAANNTDQSASTMSLGGMNATHGNASGAIAIDVRIIDAETGDVLDSVSVSEPLRSRKSGVSGVGSLMGALGAFKAGGIAGDLGTSSSHDDNIDHALRGAIEDAVLELVHRM